MKSPFLHWLKARWKHLLGEGEDSPLQSRIYHFVCLVTIAVMVYVLFFSISVQMVAFALITAVLIPLQIGLFYISRFRDRTVLSMSVYILLIHGFFAVSYRLSAGITGSTSLSFFIVFFLSLAILPRKGYLWLVLVNLGTVGALLFTEYRDPSFVLGIYTNRAEHFIDVASTYTVNIVMILFGLGYVIKNYTLEKDKAEARALLLDELNEEKARLISVISHDYYTPLSALQNYLYVLENYELTAGERKTLTTEMRRSVVNTQSLLTNLLDMTKGEIGAEQASQYNSFPVLEAVTETLNVYGDIARSAGQKMDISIPEDLHMTSNRHLFTTIIRNLINNAVKFSGRGATIFFSHEMHENHHVFRVTDTGLGISEQVQAEILDSWKDSNRNVSRSGSMGLVLSKKYAAALGADLWFEAGAGSGTTFYLKIPTDF